MKSGLGYDIHRLVDGRKLFLGGIEIPFAKGLLGHSDGDCLIHAIVDALLGALGEKDIGHHFPETDSQYKDIRSTELLKVVVQRLEKNNTKIGHIDSLVIAEKPRLAAHIPRMKETLCAILRIGPEDLGIKARTNEGLDAVGHGEAIAAW
ncbi:MAG: 2-C-methyl-D-erythritol 2,4-cyclodiphosphate synthase, partial [Candidatus Aminicenantes bacterium]|nr:2-C-methyl-D-erythritol 2,4-cyclodiphosphate synthase [Candidatus Aminicenantes bacterium]